MTTFLLTSNPSRDGATQGVLSLDGVHICYTLEDVVREVPGVPVERWKIKAETAIPAGIYRLSLENSGRFGPDTLTINNVPGFVAIRMHGGNTAANTEGCPLLGLERVGTNGVRDCAKAVALVKQLTRDALARGEVPHIEIVRT